MKTIKWSLLFVLLFYCVLAQADKYDKLWKSIEQAQKDDRPKLTLELSSQMYHLADKENNVPQQGRALAVQLDTYRKLPEDARSKIASQLEEWQQSAVDYKEKAIVHTLQCALLSNDEVDEIVNHAHYIYNYGEQLSKVSAKSYVPFVKIGKGGKVFRHRLYPLLSNLVLHRMRLSASYYGRTKEETEKLTNMQSALYEQWLSIEQEDNQLDAALLVAIGQVQHLSEPDERLKRFDTLIPTYTQCSTFLELYIARAAEAQRIGNVNLALRIAKEGISRYPNARRVRELQSMYYQIIRPSIYASIQRQYFSTDSIRIRINATNVPRVSIKIGNKTHVVPLLTDTTYSNKRTIVNLPPMPYGKYAVSIKPIVDYPDSLAVPIKTDNNTIAVSDLTALTTKVNSKTYYVLALNKLTGEAVPGAIVYIKGRKFSRTMKADSNGVALFSNCPVSRPEVSVRLPEGKADQFMPLLTAGYSSVSYPESLSRSRMHIATDRPIYHPGDSVHARVCAYEKSDVSGHVLRHKKIILTLKNPSGKKVRAFAVETDDHGVATVHIALPKQGLNGSYHLSSKDLAGRAFIEVADYQLPSFKVNALPLQKDSLKVGQPFICSLEAVQMTGLPLQNARVTYSLERRDFWRFDWSGRFNSRPETVVLRGEGVTDAKGRLSVSVTLDSLQVLWRKEYFEMSYHVVAQSGESHDAKQDFVVYGGKEVNKPQLPDSLKNTLWLAKHNYTFSPKSPAYITCRVNRPNRHVYMMYATKEKVYTKKLQQTGAQQLDSIYSATLQYTPEMHHGIKVKFYVIGDGHVDYDRADVELEQPDKTLHIQTVSFRDHLVPKTPETWKLRVLDAENKPVQATVGLWMYDSALDALAYSSNNWILHWNPSLIRSNVSEPWLRRATPDYYRYELPDFSISTWKRDTFMGSWDYNSLRIRGMVSARYRAKSQRRTKSALNEVQPAFVLPEEEHDEGGNVSDGKSISSDFLREASTPTAFFYPNLQTDKKGYVKASFKTPADLTTWKVRALAHTDSLWQGEMDTLVITNKPLMVHPTLPRFCRVGDELTLATHVSNRQDASSTVTLDWQLFDLETKKTLQEHTQKFVLKAKGQRTLRWIPKVFVQAGAVGYRVIARSKQAQDGEQHVLQVLDNQIQVKASLPFTLSPLGMQGDTWNSNMKPFEQADKIHVELTHGLYSVALQQLPSMYADGNPYCVYGSMHRYYATLLGQMILDKQPALKTWLNDEIKSKKLMTHKENALVSTPWEVQQEARRALWLDLAAGDTTLAMKKKAYVKGLKALQAPDGRFSWFAGMDASDYLTMYVLELHAHMAMLLPEGSIDAEVYAAIDKAKAWAQRRAHDCMLVLKRKEKSDKYFDPYTYLYVWALYNDGHIVPEEVRYFYNRIPKESRDIPVYHKLQVALTALRLGEPQRAQTLMHSLREYALYSGNTRSLSSAVYLTNLLGDKSEKDEVIMHALQEARTKVWSGIGDQTRIVYSLLAIDSHVPSTFSAELTLQVSSDETSSILRRGWRAVDTGLVLDDIAAPEGGFKKATVKNESSVPLWGVVSGTYKQKNTLLGAVSTSGLSIKRVLLKEVRDNHKKLWRPCTTFDKGDVVRVQLTIDAPQSMSLIQIIDRYAGALVPRRQVADFYWGYPSYYLDPKTTEMHCFIHRIPKGETVVTYEMLAQQSGAYRDNGVEIKSCYAPEYTASSDSKAITIE